MPRDDSSRRNARHAESETEESQGLLSQSPDLDNDERDAVTSVNGGAVSSSPPPPPPGSFRPTLPRLRDPTNQQESRIPPRITHKRQSSIIRLPGAPPRNPTPNRVRFNLEEVPSPEERNGHVRLSNGNSHTANGHARSPSDQLWLDDEDYITSPDPGRRGNGRGQDGNNEQRAPLLTDIEAPSVTFATEDFNPADYLESARPKSGMHSAFMNMANSIIGAGIIGQPYAFRQAGLLTGAVLLVSLTLIVDWTIRLIVINSKMSGADSFQATMQHCFGRPGLIAISLAQWAFAFGGMLAFCIIVGDTIPEVVRAIFPSWQDKSFLWLATDRRAVIVFFILGISWPLSLYRDIAKVKTSEWFSFIRSSC